MNSGNSQIPEPAVSICLPAYRNKDLLERCLNSIAIQAFGNFEVIITDDTPDTSIEEFIKTAGYTFPLQYYRNGPALGSPANWNAAIKKAKGRYIKMMHHDDWFSTAESLEKFCKALDENPTALFAFASNRDFVNGALQPLRCNFKQELENWKKNKNFIATYNFIGDPSTIIFRNNTDLLYDERMKWCVDTDFNMTLFEQNSHVIFIDEDLVYIGTHPGQVTHTVQHDAAVVLYENILMLNKHYVKKLTLKQYDFYWRMLRKFNVRSIDKLKLLAKEQVVPDYLIRMTTMQQKIPVKVLKNGLASKFFMVLRYFFS